MRKKRRTILALSITLVVIVGAYVAVTLYNHRSANAPATEPEEMVIYTCASVSDIAYSYQNEDLHFIWSDDNAAWYYEADPSFPLKQSKLTAMVRDLKSFTVLRLVQEGTDNLSDFGLDEPTLSFAAITGAGESVAFQIGARNTATGNYYLHMDGKDAVYLLDARDAAHFLLSLNELVTLDTLPDAEPDAVHEFRFSGPDGADYHFVNLETGSSSYYTDRQHWFLKDEDGTLTPVYDTRIETVLSEVLGVSYDSCLSYRPSETELQLVGLQDPLYTLTVDYTATYEAEAAEGQEPKTHTKEESFTLSLGLFFGEKTICARLAGSDMIGLVEGASLANTLQLDLSALYLRDACQLKLDEIESMTVNWNGTTYQIAAEQLEAAGPDGNKSTSVSFTVNGAPTDSASVNKFFNSITALKAESTAETDPGTAPDVTITFVRDRDSFGTMTMELVPYDSNFYLVRFADHNSLLVNRRAVQTLTGLLETL